MSSSRELAVVQQKQELVRREADELTNVQRLGNLLAASGYFADAREMAQAAVKVMAGKELGIPAIASMMGINIIKGKVAMGAHLMASCIRAHGYEFKVKCLDNSGCVLEFLDKPNSEGKRGRLGESSFREDDAKAASVLGEMYRKYPRNMYYARAMSNGVKWYCPDAIAGAPVYTPEELGAEVDEEGEVVHPEDQATRTPYRATDADLPAELLGIPEAASPPKLISESQRKLLIVAAKEGGYVDADGKLDPAAVKVVLARFGFDSSTKVTVDKLDATIRALRGEPEDVPEEDR